MATGIGFLVVSLFGCGDEATTATAECPEQSCSEHGLCAVVDGTEALCICDSGYRVGDDILTCIKVTPGAECDGVDCDGHGECVVVDGAPPEPLCICEPGYQVRTGVSTQCQVASCTVQPCAEIVANETGLVAHLAVAGGTVYTTTTTGIRSAPFGEALQDRLEADSDIVGLVADDANVYYATVTEGVYQLTDEGTQSQHIFTASGLQGLAFDGASMFCGVQISVDGTSGGVPLYGHKLQCGTLEGETVRARSAASARSSAVLGRMEVVFTETEAIYSAGTTIRRAPRAEIDRALENSESIVTSSVLVASLAHYGEHAYWVDEVGADWSLKKVHLTTGAVTVMAEITSGQQLPTVGLFASDGYIYWANVTGVWRVPLVGGEPELRAGASRLTAITQSGSNLFYADQVTQEVLRIAMP